MSSDSLYGIRATRASPPGHAGEDEDRRQVYGAALAPFDELIEAASAVGPASRPLPLFYALSQAGRAIAAAHARGAWRLGYHGLSARELDPPLLDVPVKRAAAVNIQLALLQAGRPHHPVDDLRGGDHPCREGGHSPILHLGHRAKRQLD